MKSQRRARMKYCRPRESQYMARQEMKFVIVPERTRAISIPRRRPDTTMLREVARWAGGARSPTRGSMSCGVTVETEVMKLRMQKTVKFLVMQRPILYILSLNLGIRRCFEGDAYQTVAVNQTSHRTKGLLLNKSPRGHKNSRPAAYPACATVGIYEACS